jgi:hypothetical protein
VLGHEYVNIIRVECGNVKFESGLGVLGACVRGAVEGARRLRPAGYAVGNIAGQYRPANEFAGYNNEVRPAPDCLAPATGYRQAPC